MQEKLTLLRVPALLLCMLFLLCACAKQQTADEYLTNAFSAELVYLEKNTRIVATLQAGAPRDEDDPLPRDLTLYISSPEALCGTVITRTDGTLTLSYARLCTPIGHTNLLRCAELLLSNHSGKTVEREPNTGLPCRILYGEETLEISKLQITAPTK